MLTKKKSPEPLIALILGTVFIITLLPILLIGKYNYPSADDYAYGISTFQTWQKSGSFIQVIGEAFRTAHHFYHTWQGTFSATFLMSLQPSVFGTHFYRIVPFILTGSLISSYLWFTYLLFCRIAGTSKSIWLIVGLSMLFLTIQFPFSIVEGFFWYNGSIYYGLFYACMFALFSSILAFGLTRKKSSGILYATLTVLLSVIIGGGNFVTALITPLILILGAAARYLISRKKVSWIVWVSIICLLLSLTVSAIAPGNDFRKEAVNGLSPLSAILKSFGYGGYYLVKWISIPAILVYAFLTPFLYKTARNMDFRFAYPGLFTLVTFGVFCATFTAPLYAMNMPGEGRLLNICRYSWYWLILINLFYYCGYIGKRGRFGDRIHRLVRFSDRYATPTRIGMATLLIFASSALIFKSTSNRSLSALLSGRAAQYGTEMEARYERYLSGDKRIVIKSLTVKPIVLFFSDLSEESGHWQNQDAARFFGKESIEKEPNPQGEVYVR